MLPWSLTRLLQSQYMYVNVHSLWWLFKTVNIITALPFLLFCYDMSWVSSLDRQPLLLASCFMGHTSLGCWAAMLISYWSYYSSIKQAPPSSLSPRLLCFCSYPCWAVMLWWSNCSSQNNHHHQHRCNCHNQGCRAVLLQIFPIPNVPFILFLHLKTIINIITTTNILILIVILLLLLLLISSTSRLKWRPPCVQWARNGSESRSRNFGWHLLSHSQKYNILRNKTFSEIKHSHKHSILIIISFLTHYMYFHSFKSFSSFSSSVESTTYSYTNL